MAYVIVVCGSGGKTTLCKEMAARYANENKKVCITTTTNMWFDSDVRNSFFQVEEYVVGDDILSSQVGANACEPGKVYYAGNVDEVKKKLKPLSKEDYNKLCDIFDYVIIEADGSRAMPMKIPYGVGASTASTSNKGELCEPIIPDNVNEIIIVVGMESVGRKIGYICHRFNEFYGKDKFLSDNKIETDTIVTEKLIDDFVNHYYFVPLKEKFPNAKISVYKNDYAKTYVGAKLCEPSYVENDILSSCVGASNARPFKLCMALCASGFSKRFGNENKLLAKIPLTKLILGDKYDENIFCKDEATQKFLKNEIMIYQLMIEKLLATKENVLAKFSEELSSHNLQIEIAVVTQYDEIINDKKYNDKVTMIKNGKAQLGLSSSIKIAVEKYKEFDAIMFINADLPKLDEEELTRFLYYSILNNNKMASMFTDMPKNPAYFEKEYFDEILKIEGDKGPRELLDKNIKDLYRYYIDKEQLFEIDTKEDLDKFQNLLLDEILEN